MGYNADAFKIDTAVVKFLEPPERERERSQEKKTKDKFKIVSLTVQPGVEFTPELVRILLSDLTCQVLSICHRL